MVAAQTSHQSLNGFYLKGNMRINYTLICTKGRGVGHVDISLHLPHVIINSMQALRVLSHLQITLRKAQFHINMYCLKMILMIELQCQRWFYHLS